MPKINQEEYEILKDLDDKWKWIARDRDTGKLPYSDMVHVYEEKPFKTDNVWTVGYGAGKLEKNLFQFIQWEDEEPYNIAELIEEYEGEEEKYEMLLSDFLVRLEESGIDTSRIVIEESEETEVKKDKKWLESEVDKIVGEYQSENIFANFTRYMIYDIKDAINQLDEPEVLSQEWIDEKRKMGIYKDGNGRLMSYFALEDLQNLLVPKQEERVSKTCELKPVVPQFVADHIEEVKASGDSLDDAYALLRGIYYQSKAADWMAEDKNNSETFARAWLDGYTVERELTVKGVIEKHIELLKKQEVAVNLKPYYDLLEELKDE